MNVTILYEDPSYIGFFKPAGIPTTYGTEQGCFVKQVKVQFPELFTFTGFKPEEGGLLYRLDNDACGLLLFAKNEEAFHRFNDDETLQKIYIVEISESEKFKKLSQTGLLTFPIVHKSSKKMAALLPDKKIHYHGKPLPAETHYEKLNKRLVRCRIKKGVRHQIRLHMATAGAPLVGDTLYGGKPAEMLHLCCMGILSKKTTLTPLQIDTRKTLKKIVQWMA
ncbi:MAG: RNA pseudouridine synthase [Candidatus Gracilibacteria bacterium]